MTEYPVRQRRALKLRAKRTFFRFLRPCLVCTFLLIALSLAAQLFSVVSGGTFFYTVMDVRQFPMSTGIWKADADAMTSLLTLMGLGKLGDLGGLVFSVRYDDLGQVLVFPLAWRQVVNVVVIQGIVLLVTAPLSYGVLSQYRGLLEGRVRPGRALFGWYADLRLTAKALAVQVVLTLWRLVSTLLCLLPGILCAAVGTLTPNGQIMVLLSSPLLLRARGLLQRGEPAGRTEAGVLQAQPLLPALAYHLHAPLRHPGPLCHPLCGDVQLPLPGPAAGAGEPVTMGQGK